MPVYFFDEAVFSGNTLDSQFFLSVEKEIEARLPKKTVKQPAQITVDESMLKLIEDFQSLRLSGKK